MYSDRQVFILTSSYTEDDVNRKSIEEIGTKQGKTERQIRHLVRRQIHIVEKRLRKCNFIISPKGETAAVLHVH